MDATVDFLAMQIFALGRNTGTTDQICVAAIDALKASVAHKVSVFDV